MTQAQPSITQLMDQLDHNHQQIADSSRDGLILLSLQLESLLINQKAQDYLSENHLPTNVFEQLQIYTQKHQHIQFDLKQWLQAQLVDTNQKANASTPILWIKHHSKALNKTTVTPVIIKSSPVLSACKNTVQSLLILIQDQSLKLQYEAKEQLMETSGAGQFITDSHGYICQPNQAFIHLTQLNIETLSKITYIEWLKKQVTFGVPFDSVMESLLKENCWNGEVHLTSANQTPVPAILSLSMLTDDNRNIEHFVGVLQDLSEIHAAQNKIEQLAYYDRLTGLANRTLLHNQLEDVLSRHAHSKSYSGLILLDLDSFKIINDTLGYSIGDELLILVAQKLTRLAGNGNLVVRLEGDEFAILFKEISQDASEALIQTLGLAYKIQDSLDDRYTLEHRTLHCSASIGVYLFNEPPQNGFSDELIRYANMAMHEAKNLGGNQVFQFEDRLCEVAKQRLELLQALNHSELDDEFQLYFQAQIDAQGNTISAETLLRWFHPSLGLVPPGDFIPVAEEGRQIIKIGLWVLHKAFIQARVWNEVYGNLRVSINISPVQFHEQSFVELVIGLVKFTQVNPNYITLELTEGVLIRNTTMALHKIQHLVSLGFHISIDDFGTGYSSLSYLQKLPIHELKIDQSFIQHIPENQDDVAIVDSIIKLAQNKRLNVVAEGVETEEQAEFLRQQSDSLLIQGYLFSRPAPADQFEAQFLKQSYRLDSA